MNTKQRMIAAAAIAGMALLSACGGSVSKEAAGTMMDSKQATAPVDLNKVDPVKFNKAHGSTGKVALSATDGCIGCH